MQTAPLPVKRKIKSFEPHPDVAAALDRAAAKGVKITHIINESLRKYLAAEGWTRKSDPAKEAR